MRSSPPQSPPKQAYKAVPKSRTCFNSPKQIRPKLAPKSAYKPSSTKTTPSKKTLPNLSLRESFRAGGRENTR